MVYIDTYQGSGMYVRDVEEPVVMWLFVGWACFDKHVKTVSVNYQVTMGFK